jgi:hypothetical protein
MRYARLCPVVLAVLVLSAVCFAGQVGLQFVNVGGASVGGEYVYPYYFSINGSSTLTPLICDTYDRSIGFGESWTANVYALTSGQGLWTGIGQDGYSGTKNYEAAAIIFGWLMNGSTVAGQQVNAMTGNLAIWGLFDGGRSNSGWTPYEQTLINMALASTGSQSLAFYNQFTIYTPTNTQVGGPQEFIGYSNGGIPPAALPEPASLPMSISTLVICGGFLGRKLLA